MQCAEASVKRACLPNRNIFDSAESAREEASREALMLSRKLEESYVTMSTKLYKSQKDAEKECARLTIDRSKLIKNYQSAKGENEALQGKLRLLLV